MEVFFLGTVGRGKFGRTQYVENKTHTRGQDNDIYYPKIGGRVASLVATVAHVWRAVYDIQKKKKSKKKKKKRHRHLAVKFETTHKNFSPPNLQLLVL